MKTALLLVLSVTGAGAAAPLFSPANDRFQLIGTDFKRAQEVPATFFNPFKSQANVASLNRKETATVTNESVIEAVEKRIVSGVVISPDITANHLVLGDEVFGVGDELNFPAPRRPTGVPLVEGASVLLRAIREENLEFEIRVEGEPSRRVTFPLHGFWNR